ncbi:MAG: response regulator transcription factor [Bacteroidota bacterium]
MKQIKVIIVEDEAPSRRRIKKLLAKDTSFDLLAEAENGTEAIFLIKKHRPNLVLLDIHLKDMTGFEVLEAISPEFNGFVVFITAYDQYAINAFEANAIDYLLKPFKQERFKRALTKAVEAYFSKTQPSIKELLNSLSISGEHQVIQLKEGTKTHRLDLEKIIYIKADTYYCHFYDKDASKLVRIQMKALLNQLPEYFVKINRSTIINMRKISWVKKLKKNVEIEIITGERFMATMNLEVFY